MPLSRYKKFCYRIFGDLAENSASEKLKLELVQAGINVRAGAYLAYTWMNTILSVIITGIVIPLILFVMLPLLGVESTDFISIPFFSKSPPSTMGVLLFVLVILVPFGVGFLVYFLHLTYPRRRAKMRGKKIDHTLPYALNFISAMSAAGIAPHEIFISLSKQGIYGEVKEEAARIAKDMKLLGLDIITALKRAAETTPSQRFREFLQGAIVTVTSGGTLKPYFMTKAEQYIRENRQIQKQFLETLGVMAEAYVTAAVAGPLFILIVLPLMMSIKGGAEQLFLIELFAFIIMPLVHLLFAVVIKSISPEV